MSFSACCAQVARDVPSRRRRTPQMRKMLLASAAMLGLALLAACPCPGQFRHPAGRAAAGPVAGRLARAVPAGGTAGGAAPSRRRRRCRAVGGRDAPAHARSRAERGRHAGPLAGGAGHRAGARGGGASRLGGRRHSTSPRPCSTRRRPSPAAARRCAPVADRGGAAGGGRRRATRSDGWRAAGAADMTLGTTSIPLGGVLPPNGGLMEPSGGVMAPNVH